VIEDGKIFVELRVGQSLSKEFFIFGTKAFGPTPEISARK
jgi:hypothetical protein